MSSSFLKDLEFGNRVELAWMNFMGTITGRDYEQSQGKVSGWDIHDRTENQYYEVKWDTKSCAKWKSFGKERNPTDNLFIEYVNPSRTPPKATGIRASTSKYWVYVVKHAPDQFVYDDKFGEYKCHAHLFNREKLLTFCENANLQSRDTKRDVGKGEAVNARGWILPWSLVTAPEKETGYLAVYDISAYLSLPILTR